MAEGHADPHWLAMAAAIPGKVADLIFHLSADGGRLYHEGRRLPDLVTWNDPLPTVSVGVNRGSPDNHRQVDLLASWPNCHGWMI